MPTLVIFIIGGFFVWQNFRTPKPVACTQEAKLCPDGSAVGRTGFNCEFAACPIAENYCRNDEDCACGVNINTRACFYGNKNYVDVMQQCPDFCAPGLAGRLVLKCINNGCQQVSITD